MRIFKNREIKIFTLISAAAICICAAAVFFISIPAAIICAVSGICLLCIFLIFTAARYRRIDKMSSSLDSMLHGYGDFLISESREGELYILQNEIAKLASALAEQNLRLNEEKLLLKDALADIAHQIRTPMTNLNLNISLISDENTDADERARIARDMRASIMRTDWLIETLLKLSRIDAGIAEFKSEEFAVRDLIDGSMSSLLVQAELKDQRLRVDGMTDDIIIKADLKWCCEALENILKNCIEHTPQGGDINIEVSDTGIFTQITVTDSGPGLGENDISHLFERFYRGKDSSISGFGIGLALARSIITAQNGTIKAQNARPCTGQAPCGAQFIIRFYKGIV